MSDTGPMVLWFYGWPEGCLEMLKLINLSSIFNVGWVTGLRIFWPLARPVEICQTYPTWYLVPGAIFQSTVLNFMLIYLGSIIMNKSFNMPFFWQNLSKYKNLLCPKAFSVKKKKSERECLLEKGCFGQFWKQITRMKVRGNTSL